jgi:hypothetical protein
VHDFAHQVVTEYPRRLGHASCDPLHCSLREGSFRMVGERLPHAPRCLKRFPTRGINFPKIPKW